MSISFSLFSHYGYEPFQSRNSAGEVLMVEDYLDIMHLGNCFAAAILFQVALTFCGAAFAVVVQTAT